MAYKKRKHPHKICMPVAAVAIHFYNRLKREEVDGVANDQRLQSKYGQGKWAVITGASEGIGREFAIQLANAGFNVCLSSRSIEKLQQVESTIKAQHPSVQVKCCPIDFSMTSNYDTLTQDVTIMTNLAFMVNNVGYMKPGRLLDADPVAM